MAADFPASGGLHRLPVIKDNVDHLVHWPVLWATLRRPELQIHAIHFPLVGWKPLRGMSLALVAPLCSWPLDRLSRATRVSDLGDNRSPPDGTRRRAREGRARVLEGSSLEPLALVFSLAWPITSTQVGTTP